MIKIIECPRDAIQGIHEFIPTDKKAAYINCLLKVGFDTIDFGSFVSHKSMPQMRDTAELTNMLDLSGTKTKLLAIAANQRGASDASVFDEITYIGYPFSISETFQLRNTNATIAESLVRMDEIVNICIKKGKIPVAYLSMGFGNPYGDAWNTEIIADYTGRLVQMGINIISLSDTVGVADPVTINLVAHDMTYSFPEVEFGAHLHSSPDNWLEKLEAAYSGGLKRFDSAIRGFGGCPMAQDELVGNMPTEKLLDYFTSKNIETGTNIDNFNECLILSNSVYH